MMRWIHLGVGLSLLLVLSGCLTTRNLANPDGGLPPQWAPVAQTMVEAASQMCIKVSGYDHVPRSEWQQGISLTNWAVVRFYASDTPWVKAQAISQGVFDEIFFQTESKQFICGSDAWSNFESGRLVRFVEVVPQRP